jgi:hypothetical protein
VSLNPNNAGAQCVTSDFSLAYGGGWGWNDVDCATVTTTAICKIPRALVWGDTLPGGAGHIQLLR